MRNIAFRYTAVLMALLVLASTTSWRVEKHYCMGMLIDTALFSEPDTCGMVMSLDADDDTSLNSCCDNKVLVLEGQDQLQISFEDVDTDFSLYIPVVGVSDLKAIVNWYKKSTPSDSYPPPILLEDLLTLHQVYLI